MTDLASRTSAQLDIATHGWALPTHIVHFDLPNTTLQNAMNVPESLLHSLEYVLNQRGVPALYSPIKLLAENTQAAYDAMGGASLYIHPIDELVQVLNNWQNVGQFYGLSQTDKVATIARITAKDMSLCTYAAIVRETGVRWLMHEEPYLAFKARHEAPGMPPCTVSVFNSDPNPTAPLIYDWLLACATPKQ